MQVSELSEAALLARILPALPRGAQTLLGPGDDCAVVAAPGGRFVVTTDVLVQGQHFRLEWSSGFELGARAAAQNLADVAAMGAQPNALVVSLVLPGDTDVAWVEDLAAGLGAEAARAGAGVVGGDLAAGEQLVVSVAAHGQLSGPAVTRSGARAGDQLAIAGTLGRSAAGLAALQSGRVSPSLHGAEVPYPFTDAVAAYRYPRPPYSAGRRAAALGATAMMDVSDGLVVDAGRLAAASGVAIELSRAGLSADCRALEQAGRELGVNPLDWVLYGGEDHSLLATFPAGTLVQEPFRVIGSAGGTFGAEPGGVRLEGQAVSGGWDHFAR